ncbi:MAG: serine hydrolase [Ferruginibacter sp.]|nr:serine hydrolase [Ferruginibacter sp.]
MKKILLVIHIGLFFVTSKAQMPEASIDSLVKTVLKTFDVPGISVGIVKDGKLIHAKGYGVRSLKNNLPMNENTLVGIASNSKAFTSAAIAMLVDEGKMKWDDKVRDYIPNFKMYDPYVTDAFTVRDLLTHRSGLGLGSGDLMFFPDGGNFTREEMIHNLRYLKPVSEFRTKFDYDNNLYIVAGEVIAKVSGLSWEEFIEQRIMKPIGFTSSTASYSRVKNNTNIIDAHAPADGKVIAIPHDWNDVANAAGGIMSNITDLSKWVILQMSDGQYGENKKLFSKEMHDEMWSPQTILQTGAGAYNTHFGAYGLGWFLADVKGYKQVSHTGGLAGTVTQITLLPELKLGIIVLTNQQSGAAFTAITNSIKDSYLGYENRGWVKKMDDRVKAGEAEAKKINDDIAKDIATQQKLGTTKIVDSLFVGTYNDKWFGNIVVSKKENGLWIASAKSPRLNGYLTHYKSNTFIVRWTDRSFDADAYVMFTLDRNGKADGFKMEAISPLTDFSFDFQDLDMKRTK